MDEELWKRRFMIFTFVRLTGVTVFVIGILLGLTDVFQTGGMPLIGGIVALTGAADMIFAPKLLKKHWENEDEAAGRTTGGSGPTR